MKGWLEKKIEEGFTWKTIKPLIRLESGAYDTVISSLADLPEELMIHYQYFYNIFYKKVVSESHKDPNEHKSLEKWCENLQTRNYKVLLRQNNAGSIDQLLVAWVSPWQIELFKTHSKVVCLDSTHDTCVVPDDKVPLANRKACYLYTIVAKSLSTGKGVPLSYMITSSKDR